MTKRGNTKGSRPARVTLRGALCGWLLFVIGFLLSPTNAWAAGASDDADEGGETAICTDLAESMSARAPLFNWERTTLSSCDDVGFDLGQLPPQTPYRVVQQVTQQDLHAVFSTSTFAFVVKPALLVIEHRGLAGAEEHRRLSPRPPRRG